MPSLHLTDGEKVASIVGALAILATLLSWFRAAHAQQTAAAAERHAAEANRLSTAANLLAAHANEIAEKALSVAEAQTQVRIRVEPDIERDYDEWNELVSFLCIKIINDGVACELADGGLCVPSAKQFLKPHRYRWPVRMAPKSSIKIAMGNGFLREETKDAEQWLGRFTSVGAVTACGFRAEVPDHPKVIEWIQYALNRIAQEKGKPVPDPRAVELGKMPPVRQEIMRQLAICPGITMFQDRTEWIVRIGEWVKGESGDGEGRTYKEGVGALVQTGYLEQDGTPDWTPTEKGRALIAYIKERHESAGS